MLLLKQMTMHWNVSISKCMVTPFQELLQSNCFCSHETCVIHIEMQVNLNCVQVSFRMSVTSSQITLRKILLTVQSRHFCFKVKELPPQPVPLQRGYAEMEQLSGNESACSADSEDFALWKYMSHEYNYTYLIPYICCLTTHFWCLK